MAVYRKLVSTVGLTKEQWLEYRRLGIGGSDVAKITGHSKYGTRFTVWHDKVGLAPPEDDPPSEAAYWGTELEDHVAREFTKRTGKKVRRVNAILQSRQHPHMLANLDRDIVGESAGLECKTASEYLRRDWEGDKVPDAYYLQCQHYLAVTGFDSWWIAVLIGGNTFEYKEVKRDDAFIEELIRIESDFWLHNVIENKMPEIDGSEVAEAFLKAKYPDANGQEIELDDIGDVISELEKHKATSKQIDAWITECENRIKLRLGEFERGRCGDKLVTWKNITSNRFDSKRFAKEHPSLYEQFVNVSSSRRFEVK